MAKSTNLKPFKPGYDARRNLNGGPRKMATRLAGLGYNGRDINSTILAILAMTETEATQIADGGQYTILERTVATALLKDMSRGSLWNLDTLLTRTLGKPQQTLQADTDGKIEVVFVEGHSIT